MVDSLLGEEHDAVFDGIELLVSECFLLEVVYEIDAELLCVFLEFGVKSQDVVGSISCPDGVALGVGVGEFLYSLRQFEIDGSEGYLFPHVLEVDFPFVIVELFAHFLYLAVNLLAIKIYVSSRQLPIQLIIELLLQPALEHIKQMSYLSLIFNHHLVDSFCEFPQ